MHDRGVDMHISVPTVKAGMNNKQLKQSWNLDELLEEAGLNIKGSKISQPKVTFEEILFPAI